LTTVTNASGVIIRQPFAGNQISPSRFNQTGLNLLKLFPAPNLPGIVNNYVSTPAATDRRDLFDLKLDGNISERDQVFVRISRQNTNVYTPGSLPAPAVGNAQGNTVQYPLYQVASGFTRTISPHVINEFRAGFTRLDNQAKSANYGNDVANQVGIPGVNQPGNILTTGLTEIDLSGYATLGDSGSYPAVIANNNFQFNDAVTWIYNNHTFKFGGEVLRRQENVYQAANLHGDMGFGPTYTTNPSVSGANGNSLADLVLGAPASGSITYIPGTFGKRRTDYGFYAQDSWKVTQTLTLNIGLRWDIYPQYLWVEVQNREAYFVPSLGAVYNVNTPQIPSRSGAQPRYNDLGPRVGFAYAASKQTTIRGAYGYFFSPDMGPDTGIENPPFVGSVAFSNTSTNFTGAQTVSQGFTRPPGNNFPTIGAALFSIDPHLKTPSASQYNLGIEQSLPSQILFTINYVGTLGHALILEPNINQPIPGPQAVALRRPFPLYNTISEVEGASHSNYNGLQISAEKRLAKSLQFLASYTWSHALDLGTFVSAPQNSNDFGSEYGNSDYNLPNRFSVSGTYLLPVGRGRSFGATMPMLADIFLGGWKLSTITNIYSGLPFTPTSSVNTLNGSGSQRPNRIGAGALPSGQRSIKQWFDTAAFQVPAQYQFGNSRRDILRGPATRTSDVSLGRSFTLGRDAARSLELRADAFNISNTPQLNNPNAAIGSAAAGTISSAGSPITFQRTSRQLQISGKLHF
jgi:TonB dependent receptor